MKVLLVSDIHSCFYGAETIYALEDPDLVLDCGDHEGIRNLFGFTPHYHVYGNHEPSLVLFSVGDMSLPHEMHPGQKYVCEKEGVFIRFAGIGGNYTTKKTSFRVSAESVSALEELTERSVDVVMLHESPLNALFESSPHNDLARRMVRALEKINPEYVFAGHKGSWLEETTKNGVNIVNLDEMSKGYALLNISESGEFELERKIRIFGKC